MVQVTGSRVRYFLHLLASKALGGSLYELLFSTTELGGKVFVSFCGSPEVSTSLSTFFQQRTCQ